MIELGRKVKDKVTGFEGTVTGFVTYITGCNQALVTPKVQKDGSSVDPRWYDEQRLEYVGVERIVLDNRRTPGADMEAPIR
jgi:hypothetical protein